MLLPWGLQQKAPFLIERRGRPVAMLAPVPVNCGKKADDILTAWEKWDKKNGPKEPMQDFPEIENLRKSRQSNPLR